jgi:hypothetical protein
MRIDSPLMFCNSGAGGGAHPTCRWLSQTAEGSGQYEKPGPSCKHRLSMNRFVTSVKKLSHGHHLPSKCRSLDNSLFGNTSLLSCPSKNILMAIIVNFI